jgi:hypothetical protein
VTNNQRQEALMKDRSKLKHLLRIGALCLIAGSLATSAQAADFDFAGTFTYDNDISLLNFSVGQTSTITIFSSSWIAGDSGLGFDPILAIWDNAGNYLYEQDDGGNVGSTLSNGVLYQHGTWDSYFSVSVGAGNYTASIAQYSNFRNGGNLSNGFTHDGNPNFTYDAGWGPQPYFNGVWSGNDGRTGDWEFHILDVDSASVVPEPATVTLLGICIVGLGGYGFIRRRRNS